MALRRYTSDPQIEKIREADLTKFEEAFRTLSSDVQNPMYHLFCGMFAWGVTPSRWSKTAKTQFRGSRIQLDSALPVLQILSPSIKIEELIGFSTVYAPDTFYVVWETDDFVVPIDLTKLKEIISTHADRESGRR